MVEDDPISRRVAEMTIQNLGFLITSVCDEKEALNYINAAQYGAKRKPDVILMDIKMAGIGGMNILRHQEPYTSYLSGIPVIALTAFLLNLTTSASTFWRVATVRPVLW